MRPEKKAEVVVELNEEEKSIFEIIKANQKMLLEDLKNQAALSNKKWDNAIKNLTKNNLLKVSKVDDVLFVDLV